MGWLGSSKSTTTQAATVTPTNPAWVDAAVQSAVSAGQTMQNRPFTPYTGTLSAGLDPLQTQARTTATANAGGWQPGVDAAGAAVARGIFMTPRDVATPNLGPAATAGAVRAAPVTGVTGTTTAPGMGTYRDPWQAQVTDAALSAIRRTGDKAQATLGQTAAAQGAFGGSREAILRGEIERGVAAESGDAAARIASEGFRTAAGLSQSDAERAQQANLFTAGARNTSTEAAAGRRQEVNLFNAGERNTQGRTQGALNLEAQQSNQGADAGGADRALVGANLFRGLAETTGAQGREDVGMFDTLGAAGRDVTQDQLSAAYNEWMRGENSDIDNYRLMLEGVYGAPFNLFNGNTSTGTNATRSYSSGQMLGQLGSLASAGATLFSDRRLKADATPLGVDARGIRWWRYRYLWDGEGVARVGVMADELAGGPFAHALRTGPGGFFMIDYGVL